MFTIPDPLLVADGTYLVRPLVDQPPAETGEPMGLHMSSMVIVGAEPVLVDTGAASLREDWIEQTFGLVDPDDVRWIFLSHADADHVGNLPKALELCPQATVVTTWPGHHHICATLDVPTPRRRHLGDGEALDLPDRQLLAVRPPTFDSPTTCGLLDTTTGVYWAADCFGTAVHGVVDHLDDLPRDMWCATVEAFAMELSPWLAVVDPECFDGWVDRVADLTPAVIAGAHGPLVRGDTVGLVIDHVRQLPRRRRPAADRRRRAIAFDRTE
jgi:flavorubredoxin